MADALLQLREYATGGRLNDIKKQDDLIVFGDQYGWPHTTRTYYAIWNSDRDGAGKREYYTLETLVFFLKHSHLPHPQYTREAVNANIPVVRLPDRKELLAYLTGQAATAAGLDRTAPIEVTLPILIRRLQQEQQQAAIASESEEKRAKLEQGDVSQEEGAQASASDMAASQEAEKAPVPVAVPEGFSADKFAEIIAKRKKIQEERKKTHVQGDKLRLPDGVPISGELAIALERFPASTANLDLQRDVYSRERRWRSRLTILRAPAGTKFTDSIFATLQAVKAAEDGKGQQHAPATSLPSAPMPSVAAPARKPGAMQGYSRYDQEKFIGRRTEADDFNINTMASYTLATSAAKLVGSVPPSPADSLASRSPNSDAGSTGGDSGRAKKTSRTPIIIIPAAATSMITMMNVKELLQEMRYVSSDEKKAAGAKWESEMLIQRQKDNGLTVHYRVIDGVARLQPGDWDRVVGVFVQGPAWQFKGWPWNGNPVEIFAHIKAFHLKWVELPLDTNVKNWSVNVISLARNKRHLDRAALQQFWDILDRFMAKQKSHLRF